MIHAIDLVRILHQFLCFRTVKLLVCILYTQGASTAISKKARAKFSFLDAQPLHIDFEFEAASSHTHIETQAPSRYQVHQVHPRVSCSLLSRRLRMDRYTPSNTSEAVDPHAYAHLGL
jgi:hypothetical protein